MEGPMERDKRGEQALGRFGVLGGQARGAGSGEPAGDAVRAGRVTRTGSFWSTLDVPDEGVAGGEDAFERVHHLVGLLTDGAEDDEPCAVSACCQTFESAPGRTLVLFKLFAKHLSTGQGHWGARAMVATHLCIGLYPRPVLLDALELVEYKAVQPVGLLAGGLDLPGELLQTLVEPHERLVDVARRRGGLAVRLRGGRVVWLGGVAELLNFEDEGLDGRDLHVELGQGRGVGERGELTVRILGSAYGKGSTRRTLCFAVDVSAKASRP
jgi:hypothetical protein